MWSRALAQADGAKVPIPWSLGIEPMRGQLMVVVGAPGVGKSAFALNWALKIQEPSLILSLDTDLRTQAARAAAIHAGAPIETVRQSPARWALYLDRYVDRTRIYDLTLGTRELDDLVAAEQEYWGSPPALVVVDNVSNLLKESTYEAYRQTFVDLHKIARRNDTCVVALHHAKRDAVDGPLTMHSMQFTGEQEAELVLGLWKNKPNPLVEFGSLPRPLSVGILKNRNGPAGHVEHLIFDPQTMRMEEKDDRSRDDREGDREHRPDRDPWEEDAPDFLRAASGDAFVGPEPSHA